MLSPSNCRICLATLALLSLLGCQQRATSTTASQTPVLGSPSTPPKPVVVNDLAAAQSGDLTGNYNMAQVWAWGQLRGGLEAFATSHGRWPTSLEEMEAFEAFRFPVGPGARPGEVKDGGGVTLDFLPDGSVRMRTSRFDPDHTTKLIEHSLRLDKFIQPRTSVESVPETEPRSLSSDVWQRPADEAFLILRGTSPDQRHLLAVSVLESWQDLLNGYHRLNGHLPESSEALESTFPVELRDNPFISVSVLGPQEVVYVLHPDADSAHDLSFRIEYVERTAQAVADCPTCGSGKFATNVASTQVGNAQAISGGTVLDP